MFRSRTARSVWSAVRSRHRQEEINHGCPSTSTNPSPQAAKPMPVSCGSKRVLEQQLGIHEATALYENLVTIP